MPDTKPGVPASRPGDSDRYRLLAELAQDQIFIVDRDDRIEYVNRAAAEQFGAEPEQMIGRLRTEFFPPPVDVQQKRNLDTVFQTGAPLYIEGRAVFYGREAWLGTWLTPIKDERGIVTAIIGSSRDLTERWQAEEAQRASEDRLRAVVSNVPLVLWTTDRDGVVTYCGGRGLQSLGLSPADVVGGRFEDLPVGECHELLAHVRTALDGTPASGAVEVQALTCEAWCVPQRDTQGRMSGMVGLLLDVSERRRLELELSTAQTLETLGRLAGGIAHDFNNHLTAIIGYVEMMREQIGEDKPISNDLAEVSRAADRAAGLVRRLLAFGRRELVQFRRLDLNTAVAEMRPMLDRLIGEHISIVVHLAADLAGVNGDAGQLEQVLMNLSLNARDAMPHGGTLTVETRNLRVGPDTPRPAAMPPGDYVALVVRDTGTGMDAETRARLFEPFFTTKPMTEGTGLGLSTVYGIVSQAGGFIDVDSEVGRGTTFTLYWPATPAAAPAPAAPARAAQPPVVGRETVLLVEDDDNVRRFARLALERHGFHVKVAAVPDEAVTIVADTDDPIHLLVTDVVMPGMSGPDLALELQRRRPGLPVLYISGYPANLIEQRGRTGEGPIHLLSKPFTSSDLLANVEQALGRGEP